MVEFCASYCYLDIQSVQFSPVFDAWGTLDLSNGDLHSPLIERVLGRVLPEPSGLLSALLDGNIVSCDQTDCEGVRKFERVRKKRSNNVEHCRVEHGQEMVWTLSIGQAKFRIIIPEVYNDQCHSISRAFDHHDDDYHDDGYGDHNYDSSRLPFLPGSQSHSSMSSCWVTPSTKVSYLPMGGKCYADQHCVHFFDREAIEFNLLETILNDEYNKRPISISIGCGKSCEYQ